MADPAPPQPTPFPIKIVGDPPRSIVEGELEELPSGGDGKKRSDYFYPAWDKFLAIEPGRAKTTSAIVRATAKEQDAVAGKEGLKIEENAAKSWEQAAAECKAKVAAIVEECERLNQKYRDAIFDLETNDYCLRELGGKYPKAVGLIDPPPWIKRVEDIFDEPQFFIDGASATDVHQGSSGDCWYLAALMAISAKKELVDRVCVARNEKAGVYGFVFHRDGEWIHEVIDDKLFMRVGDDDDLSVVRDWDKDGKEGMGIKHSGKKLKKMLQRGGKALYFSHCNSNETWLPLIEKAYAKAHGDYYSIEGGFASEAIEDLTGGVGIVLNPEDIMDKDRFWKEQLSQVNEKYLFGGGSKPSAQQGFVSSHAYAVLKAWEEGDLRLLKLRNPWGKTEWQGDWSDGSKLWTPEMMQKLDHKFGDDGVFWISYKDFLKHFPSINRVRLLDHAWQVAQQWTSVNVPWTVDYLDTKFQFTIDKKCAVVIVLSQPDDRYWYALRGRFLFSLHFRVMREGEEEKWLVRSLHNSGNETAFTRSVSAEIQDLEPGTYNVLVKITATRVNALTTSEEAIFKYAHDRKEKLLHVGRRYDYAQTKGNLRGLEKANKQQAKQEVKDRDLQGYRSARKLNQKVKERQRKAKKRIDEAMREKHKAFVMKQREKAKARKARIAEKRAKRAAAAMTEEEADEAEAEHELGEKDIREKMEKTPPGDGEEEESADEESNEEPKYSKATKQGKGRSKKTPPEEEEAEGGDEESDDDEEQGSDEEEWSTEEEDETKPKGKDDKALAKGMSGLNIQEQDGSEESSRPDPVSPINECDDRADEDVSDSEYESPPDPPEEMDDDDFDWDSDIDRPVYSDEEEEAPRLSATGKDNEIFADDPWNAMCVLGLRVYAQNAVAKVRVIKGKNNA